MCPTACTAALSANTSALRSNGESAFQSILNSLEAILINRFPHFATQEILAMLDLKMADIPQTHFYSNGSIG